MKMNPSQEIRWPLFLLLLALLFAGITGWSIHRAATGVSPVMDRDYYQQGLRYDKEEHSRQKASALGWTLTPTKRADSLELRLTDAAGMPVDGGRGRLMLKLPKEGDFHENTLPLKEVSPGLYTVDLPQIPAAGIKLTMILGKDDAALARHLFIQPEAPADQP